jgi:hypothetical protein
MRDPDMQERGADQTGRRFLIWTPEVAFGQGMPGTRQGWSPIERPIPSVAMGQYPSPIGAGFLVRHSAEHRPHTT